MSARPEARIWTWEQVPLADVPIECIRPMKLAPKWSALLKVLLVMWGVLEPRSGDHYPHLMQDDPTVMSYRLVDGHHRVTVLAIIGRRTIQARIGRGYMKGLA